MNEEKAIAAALENTDKVIKLSDTETKVVEKKVKEDSKELDS